MLPSEEAAAAGVTAPTASAAAAGSNTATDGQSSPQDGQEQLEAWHAASTAAPVPSVQQQEHSQNEHAQPPATEAVAAEPATAGAETALLLQPPLPPTHRLKHVQLPEGRSVPVVMQSENGPCPLLAIANVLLLRGNIYLPTGASDVTQVRSFVRASSDACTDVLCRLKRLPVERIKSRAGTTAVSICTKHDDRQQRQSA